MSSKEFYKVKVKKITRETPDCVSIVFDIPKQIIHEFNFKPGQHVIIKKELNGNEIRRTYSICSSPYENEIKIAVKRIENGIFSNFAIEELKTGDSLEIMPPHGRFFIETNSENSKYYIAFAAGSGITPIISIVKSILNNEPLSNITLFYGNKKSNTTIFLEEIEALKNYYIDRFSVFYIMSREIPESPLLKGHLDFEKCIKLSKYCFSPKVTDEVFICGPKLMTENIKKCLTELGIDNNKIHHELFTNIGYTTKTETSEKLANIKSNITIINDGNEINFNLETSDENILDAALKNGANLPFACKGGVCCTCRAKLLDGEVKMDINYSLEPNEIENGYILTCQSHPVSKNIKITFDEV